MKPLILLFTAWLASHCTCAQQVRVSLNNAPFSELIKAIEKQTAYSFVYSTEGLRSLPPVTIQSKSKDLFALLDEQLAKSSVGYMLQGMYIVLYTKNVHSLVSRTLRGRVTNVRGQLMQGITIGLINETGTTTTDTHGDFVLSYTSADAIIRITGAEIEPLTLAVNDREYMVIAITESIKQLDETIIIAYGQTTRRLNTGHAVKIDAATLQNQPGGNLLSALQGRVPGLLITATSGVPGASYITQLRGQSSVNPNPLINNGITPLDQPLIIVNGIPFAPQNNNVNQLSSLASPGNLEIYHNPYGGISPLTINPADIQSVEILKDADMTAIYGSRAANGIILITTKQPGTEKNGWQFSVNSGIRVRPSLPSMLNTKQYLDLRRQAFLADSLQPGLIPGSINYAPDLLVFDSSKYTNWGNYFFHQLAPVSSFHGQVSGKRGPLSFLSAIGYRRESYLLKGDFSLRQVSLNNRVSYQSKNRRFNTEAGVYFSGDRNTSVRSATLLLQSLNLSPNHPALESTNGVLNWQYNGIEFENNPAALLRQPYYIKTADLITTLHSTYNITSDLMIKINSGYNRYAIEETVSVPGYTLSPSRRAGAYAVSGRTVLETKLIEPQISFRKSKDQAFLSFLAGATLQKNTALLTHTDGSQYRDDASLGSLAAAGLLETRTASDHRLYKGFFGRLSLRYADRYLVNLTGRREASSRLSNNHQYGNFVSAAAGWIFTNEKKIRQALPWIKYGKLRISYGTAGNDNIGYYPYQEAWAITPAYGNSQSLMPEAISNTGFTWSMTRKFETGLELGFFGDKLSVSISRYHHRSSNQLISQLSSSQPNTGRYITNFPALVKNTGWEISLDAAVNGAAEIKWNTDLNLTIPKNRLSSFPGIENSLYAGRYFSGQPLGALPLLQYKGIDQQTGIYIFANNATDFKDLSPKLYGGWVNTVSFRKTEIELFIEFKKQNGANYLQQIHHYPAGMAVNQPASVMDHWQNAGDGSTYQRLTVTPYSAAESAAYFFMQSDAAHTNASYIRLRNVQFAYSPGSKFLKQAGLKECKFYVQLQNIFTLTSFSTGNPELQSFYAYPLPKTILAGFRLQL